MELVKKIITDSPDPEGCIFRDIFECKTHNPCRYKFETIITNGFGEIIGIRRYCRKICSFNEADYIGQ